MKKTPGDLDSIIDAYIHQVKGANCTEALIKAYTTTHLSRPHYTHIVQPQKLFVALEKRYGAVLVGGGFVNRWMHFDLWPVHFNGAFMRSVWLSFTP